MRSWPEGWRSGNCWLRRQVLPVLGDVSSVYVDCAPLKLCLSNWPSAASIIIEQLPVTYSIPSGTDAATAYRRRWGGWTCVHGQCLTKECVRRCSWRHTAGTCVCVRAAWTHVAVSAVIDFKKICKGLRVPHAQRPRAGPAPPQLFEGTRMLRCSSIAGLPAYTGGQWRRSAERKGAASPS